MNGERPFPQFPGIAGRREISAQAGDIRHQFPHVFLSGGPAHAEAHRAVGFILPAQIGKAVFPPQLLQNGIRHRDKLLVRSTGKGKRQPSGTAKIPQHHSQAVRMGAQPEIKAVAEQLQELNAQKPPFRKTPALLLGDVTKILLQGLMPQNQGFTKQSAYLRAADVKSIAKGGNRRQIQVIVLIAQAVAEACSVHIQIQPPPAATPEIS